MKLTSNQAAMLRALVRHNGYWASSGGAQWNWGTTAQTVDLLEILERRGLVMETHETYYEAGKLLSRTVYTLTTKGWAAALASVQERVVS